MVRALLALPGAVRCDDGLSRLRMSVEDGLVPIREVREALLGMMASIDPELRAAGWRALCQPWATTLDAPLVRLRKALASDHEQEVFAAADAAGLRGLWVELAPLLRARTAAVRRCAIRWAGKLGDRDTLSELLTASLADSDELGAAALAALVELHHRGVFVQCEQAADVLELLSRGAQLEASAKPTWDTLAGVLYVARREVAKLVHELDVDDPDWLHLLPLVVALLPRMGGSGQDAERNPMMIELLRVARASRRPAVIRMALESLRKIAIDSPRGLAAPVSEDAQSIALARLRTFPEASLQLLEAVASTEGLEALEQWLAESTQASSHDQRESEAFSILWHGSPPSRRTALLALAEPKHLPSSVFASMGSHSPEERDALRRRRGVDRVEDALIALCEIADANDLPTVTMGLLRVAERIAGTPTPRFGRVRDPWDEPNRVTLGEESQQLPEPVVAAIDSMAARWRKQGAIRPPCLLGGERRLLPTLVLNLLDPLPSAEITAVFLRSLLSREHPALPALACSLLRHEDGDVAKLAARLLARHGAAWMALELQKGIRHRDDRRARACLLALASEGESWAAAACMSALDHPNMSVKKAAADALARVATPACAGALLGWLGRDDNPGLRTALGTALKQALGGKPLPAILAALDAIQNDAPREGLLVQALDGWVSAGQVRAVARQKPGWERGLLRAVAEGKVKLRSGTQTDLTVEFEAAGLAYHPTSVASHKEALSLAVDELLDRWSAERAEALLDRWPASEWNQEVFDKLRPRLDAWLAFMIHRRDTRPAALLVSVLARPTELERRWIHVAFPDLITLFSEVQGDAKWRLLPALERVVEAGDVSPLVRLDLGMGVREALGTEPGMPRSLLGLMAACGLVLTRDDVERGLDRVKSVPDPAAVRRTILADAFGVTPMALTDPDASCALQAALRAHSTRELEELRRDWTLEDAVTLPALAHELPDAPRGAWRAALDWMESMRPIGVCGPDAATSWPLAKRIEQTKKRKVARGKDAPMNHQRRLLALRDWLSAGPNRGAPSTEWAADAGLPALKPPLSLLDRFLPEELDPLAATDEGLTVLAPLLHGASWTTRFPAAVASFQDRFERGSPTLRRALSPLLQPVEHARVALASTREAQDLERRAWTNLWTTPFAASEMPAATDRAGWAAELGSSDPERVRRAMSKLAEAQEEGWSDLLLQLVGDRRPRVRIHALRLARKTLDRASYLRAARSYLGDPIPDLRRSAVRILCHGQDESAIEDVVLLLEDPIAWVRSEVLEGLKRFGARAVPIIERACHKARPDIARRFYDEPLAVLRAAAELE
ncbi:MAG: hypothetical protein HY898_07375 [Deltaproteobacteria bacterium]|nr:hypothetical protein [Deltaproteobacteria bacterium]